MRYWAYIQGMTLGPFSREELLSLPGFVGSTPVCPEGRDGGDPSDWTRACDLGGFLAGAGAGPAPMPPGRPASMSMDRMLIEAQARIERLEETMTRLESDKAIKDGIIASLRVELMRLANETRAAKADLRLAERSARYQREACAKLEEKLRDLQQQPGGPCSKPPPGSKPSSGRS